MDNLLKHEVLDIPIDTDQEDGSNDESKIANRISDPRKNANCFANNKKSSGATIVKNKTIMKKANRPTVTDNKRKINEKKCASKTLQKPPRKKSKLQIR